MTLQQLRCLCEVVDHGLNLSRAARALHTSQPAVTKMIRALEGELGVEILVRAGPRIVTVSERGQEIVARARQVLHDISNLRLAAGDSLGQGAGALRLATTHLHARYALVDIIRRFSAAYPGVDVNLILGTPEEIAAWTAAGEVDLGLCTLPGPLPANLFRLEAYPIARRLIARPGHPILKKRRPTLKDIGRHPLITYDGRFKTGELVERAFMAAGIAPKVTLKATAADVVKTYVAAGLGIAIVQAMAVEKQDRSLRVLNVDHLFPPSMSWIMLRKDQYLRRFIYELIALISPRWTPAEIDRARRGAYRRPGAGAEPGRKALRRAGARRPRAAPAPG